MGTWYPPRSIVSLDSGLMCFCTNDTADGLDQLQSIVRVTSNGKWRKDVLKVDQRATADWAGLVLQQSESGVMAFGDLKWAEIGWLAEHIHRSEGTNDDCARTSESVSVEDHQGSRITNAYKPAANPTTKQWANANASDRSPSSLSLPMLSQQNL